MPRAGIFFVDEAGRQARHGQAVGCIAARARHAGRATMTHAITGPRFLRVGLADPPLTITLNALRFSHVLSRGNPKPGAAELGVVTFHRPLGEKGCARHNVDTA